VLTCRSPLGKRWGQLLLPMFLLAACSLPLTTAPADSSPTSAVSPSANLPEGTGDTASTTLAPDVSAGAQTTPAAPVPTDANPPEGADDATPLPTPTPSVPPMPIPTPAGPPTDVYIVQPGDTLSAIALYRCGCEMEELATFNGIQDPASLQAGQSLLIPIKTDRVGPAVPLLPDSEVVYSPASVDFNVADFIREQGGYLADYSELVNGEEVTGAEIVEMVSGRFSVGPRMLLALLEYKSEWVTGRPATESAQYFPLGLENGGRAGLYFQLSWAANHINEGYYGYKRDGTLAFRFADGGRALAGDGLNAGTVGIQNVLALTSDWEMWRQAVGQDGFIHTYNALFGDPYARAMEPLVPADLTQPMLYLPWEGGHTWYFSGGPHAAWGEGSAWAALDFAPPDVRGHCAVSGERATAAAPGLVLRSGDGQILIDLDGDGHEQTGWVLFYLHALPDDQVQAGMMLGQGDLVGYPSCEGGVADSSHLHIARRYNGEWIAADGPVPMVLSGWRAVAGLGQYEGQLIKGDEIREACECWEDEKNGLVSDNIVLDVGE
jgi:LasA protease